MGPLRSGDAETLRMATALLEKQCADQGVSVDLDRPFAAQ